MTGPNRQAQIADATPLATAFARFLMSIGIPAAAVIAALRAAADKLEGK